MTGLLQSKTKKSIVVAYIDYSEAFDTISHDKLQTKLSAYGITGNLIEWMRSFFK